MNTAPSSTKPPMTTLAALITSCVLTVACGGGGGGESAPGSQSVTPTSETISAPSVAASDAASAAIATAPASAASASTAVPKSAQTLDASDHKEAATPAKGAEAAVAAPVLPGALQFASASTQSTETTDSGAPTSSGTDPAVAQQASQVVAAEEPNAKALAAQVGGTSTNAATVQARLERLKLAVSSMKVQQHEVKPACSPCTGWGKKPLVVMGAEPYGTAIPSNWTGTRFDQWKAILPWFVIYEGVGGNPATNTAVEINGIEIWAYSLKDKIWKKLNSGALPTWSGSYKLDAAAKSTVQGFSAVSKTVASYAPTASVIVHGGLGQVATPWNTTTDKDDVGALYVSVRHRLVLKNSSLPDDRGIANLTLNVGADYYPWLGAQLADLKATYVPGSGLGQFLKVSSQWRYSSYFVSKASVTADQILKASPPAFVY